MISGKELKSLIPTILKKSGEVNYKITKQSDFNIIDVKKNNYLRREQ